MSIRHPVFPRLSACLAWTFLASRACIVVAGEMPAFMAVYAEKPPAMDGDDSIWARATSYPLHTLPVDAPNTGEEGGRFRLAWNEEALYVFMELTDFDANSASLEDGEPHYANGDAMELFLYYEPAGYYWEMHATPHGLQTILFYENAEDARGIAERAFSAPMADGGAGSEFSAEPPMRIAVSASVDGVFNNALKRDRGYRIALAVPADELTKRGAAWGPGAAWRILIGRYNYTWDRAEPELSASSPLTSANFHLLDEYVHLVFEKDSQ